MGVLIGVVVIFAVAVYLTFRKKPSNKPNNNLNGNGALPHEELKNDVEQ